MNLVQQARYTDPPAFAGAMPQQKPTAAQANGLRYERKVGLFLGQWAKKEGYTVQDHPWIQWQDSANRWSYAQPDFVLLSERDDNLLIIDSKVRHTRDVVPQLRRYRAIIEHIHPYFKPSCVEICRYFDSSECRIELLPELRPHSLECAAVIFEPQSWISLNS